MQVDAAAAAVATDGATLLGSDDDGVLRLVASGGADDAINVYVVDADAIAAAHEVMLPAATAPMTPATAPQTDAPPVAADADADVAPPLRLLARRTGAHDSDVNCVAWHPHDATLLASAGDDSVLKIWRVDVVNA
jgi:WD40 repeat protein